jgi:hypothetical protein
MEELIDKSFIAELHVGSADDLAPLGSASLGDPSDDAWWVRREDGESGLRVRFEFVEHADSRAHYKLYAGPEIEEYEGATLGFSQSGYLGFYCDVPSPMVWQVERVEGSLEGEDLLFLLFDGQERQVAIAREAHVAQFDGDDRASDDWLVVGSGEPATFRVKSVEML